MYVEVFFITVSFLQFFLLKPLLSQEDFKNLLSLWTTISVTSMIPSLDEMIWKLRKTGKNKLQAAEQLMRQFVLYLQSSTRHILAPKLLDPFPNFLSVPFLKSSHASLFWSSLYRLATRQFSFMSPPPPFFFCNTLPFSSCPPLRSSVTLSVPLVPALLHSQIWGIACLCRVIGSFRLTGPGVTSSSVRVREKEREIRQPAARLIRALPLRSVVPSYSHDAYRRPPLLMETW